MPKAPGATLYVPEHATLPALTEAVQGCRGCDLYKFASQAVFGAGPAAARAVFVGEQPGDEEDRKGRPFVGPAGRLLDRGLEDAGIDRADVYITNTVKHFKFEERGKRRIHKKPGATEINACRPWMEAEMALIRPEVIVCLGATAAQAILGPEHRLTKDRGTFTVHPWAPHAMSTIHPSAILRATDEAERRAEYERFVDDLRKVSAVMKGTSGAGAGAPRRLNL